MLSAPACWTAGRAAVSVRGGGRRVRLDHAVVDRGLAASRERAKALILAGRVLVDGAMIDKPGTLVSAGAGLAVTAPDHPYVSRGGVKLEAALATFQVAVTGRVCLDLGASTGGFTDCLLQHGASLVYAVDVGRGQLDVKLRTDPRVVVMERTHVRTLTPSDLPVPPDLCTVDLSFISLVAILPVVPPLLTWPGEVIVLVKPQFEVGRGRVGRGGVVRDPDEHRRVIARVGRRAIERGLRILDARASCLLGPMGNREFFLHLAFATTAIGLDREPPVQLGPGIEPDEAADRAVAGAS